MYGKRNMGNIECNWWIYLYIKRPAHMQVGAKNGVYVMEKATKIEMHMLVGWNCILGNNLRRLEWMTRL